LKDLFSKKKEACKLFIRGDIEREREKKENLQRDLSNVFFHTTTKKERERENKTKKKKSISFLRYQESHQAVLKSPLS